METAVMLGSAVITGFLYYRLRKDTNYRCLNQIKDAPRLSIDQDLQTIVSEAPDNTIPYAVIKGSVEAIGKPLQSEHTSGIMGVLQMLIRREMFLWRDTTRVISTIRHSIPFVIKDNNTGVKVDDPFSATGLEIPIVHNSYEASPRSLLQYIIGNLATRPKCFQTTERMLSEGTVLTGIGKLSTSTGALVLSPTSSADRPYILSDIGFYGIVRDFQVKLNRLEFFLFIFGSITALLVARWFYKRHNQREHRTLISTGDASIQYGTVSNLDASDHILHGTVSNLDASDHILHGTFKCDFDYCGVCSHFQESRFFDGHCSKTTYSTVGHITCETANVIYLISCRFCGKQYVGETGNALKIRIGQHLGYIRRNESTSVGEHFNEPYHSISDVIVQGIECRAEKEDRLKREKYWITHLETLQPGGINKRC